jgi:hypothetical protein
VNCRSTTWKRPVHCLLAADSAGARRLCECDPSRRRYSGHGYQIAKRPRRADADRIGRQTSRAYFKGEPGRTHSRCPASRSVGGRADFFAEFPDEQQDKLFRHLSTQFAARLVGVLPCCDAYVLLHSRSGNDLNAIVDRMNPGRKRSCQVSHQGSSSFDQRIKRPLGLSDPGSAKSYAGLRSVGHRSRQDGTGDTPAIGRQTAARG